MHSSCCCCCCKCCCCCCCVPLFCHAVQIEIYDFWANMKLQKSYSFASFAFMFELLLWFIVVIKYSILWLELLIIHERHASKKWKEKDSRYSSVDSSALAILSSCGSTFESQVQHPRFFNLVSNWRLKFSLYCGKDKINKKEAGVGPLFKKDRERKKEKHERDERDV